MLMTIKDLEKPGVKKLFKHVDLISRIHGHLEAQNKNRTPDESTFTASTLGGTTGRSLCGRWPMGCGRLCWYRYMGFEERSYFNPRTRLIFGTGDAIHDQLQGYCKEIADDSDGTEEFEAEVRLYPDDSPISKEWEIKCRADGLYIVYLNDATGIKFCLEIKSINDNGFQKLSGPKPEHLVQLQIGMACADTPLGLTLYYNKNDSAMAQWRDTFNHDIWNAVKEKIYMVREHAFENTPPPRESGSHCKECRYAWVCEPPKYSRAKARAPHNTRRTRRSLGRSRRSAL